MKLWTALLTLLLVAAPIVGQDEVQPFFSLSSDKTFGPGEKAVIHLSATEIKELDFRVYKVKDPVAFFQKLDDPHMFGGRAPKEPQELVPLESFHKWKVNWRQKIVETVRAQFTHESRVAVANWRNGTELKEKGTQGPVTEYAPVPVLNQEQLVATWHQKVQKKNRWDMQVVNVPVKDPGVYLVEAVHRQLTAYTVVMVSDLAMISKTQPGRLVAFVVHRKTGEPAANVKVTMWAARKEGRTLTTNAEGLIDTPVGGLKADQLMVLARMDNHVALSGLYAGAFDTDAARSTLAYIYTDRPVYRPGHEVHFKGILRTHGKLGYELPPSGSADVEIVNEEGTTVYQKSLSISRMGSVQGDFKVPADAGLGYYSINIKQGEQRGQAGFQVEEYKKPEYEVRVTPEKQRLVQGEPIKAVIDAKYYYGEPVPNAKVTYVVHKSRYWFPRFYDDDADESDDTQDDYAGQQADEQEGKLDADGKLTVSIPTTLSESKTDTRYRIEARVMDSGNREIAGASSVIATVGEFAVNARPDQYVAVPNRPTGVTVQVRSYDDRPVQGASVHVELMPYNWKEKEQQPAVATADAQSDAQGNAKVTVTPPSAGSFRVRAQVKGPGPRAVEDVTYLWVTGSGSVWGDSSQQVTLVPDKKSYQAGDTAKILIVTGVPTAKVLFTTEGQGVEMLRVVNVQGPTAVVEVPVKAENVPYLNVSASFIREGQMYQGTKRVKVPPTAQQLNVEVTPSKPSYKPGEAAQFVVTAKDAQGRPAQGEFSLSVVDEAIYAIRRDATPDMIKFFYGQADNMVATDNSLSYYFTGEAGKRRMQLTKLARSTTLAQLKPDRLVQPKIRKAFPDTALWSPTLTTDAQGKAIANLTFPDSLTTWRATARGITLDAKVGNAIAKTIVRKDLLISLSVPRFFTQGDETVIAGLVRNYLPREKTARVSLNVKGLEIIDGAAKDVTVPSKGEGKVEWRVRAQANMREATLLGKALTDEESDGVELTLPVNPQGIKLSRAKSGSLSGDKDEIEMTFDVPPQTVPGSRRLTVQVAPSVAGALFGAMDYLVTFPYGCTEQTMSSFLPNIVVARALREAGTTSNVDRPGLDKKIKAGLERLYDFQHEDGGWGWWKTDESNIFLTSYVLAGLAQAQEAGQEIKQDAIDNGKQWLTGALAKQPNLKVDLRAYAIYALALNGVKDKALLNYVWEHRDRLSFYGNALFGLALEQSGDNRSAQIASELEAKARIEGDEASWPNNHDDLMDFYQDTTSETSAYALKLLVKKNPKSPLLEKVALYLMNHRTEGNYWYSTKQTAMVIYGLTDYLKATGELKPDFTAKVSIDGSQKLSQAFTAPDALSPKSPTVDVPAAGGPVKVKVVRSGPGRLYWSVREDYYASGEKLAAVGKSSLSVSRQYFKMVSNKTGEKVVYDLQPIDGPLAPGDTIAVRLTMTGDPWSYMLIEDPIPAGTEFIERDDLYELREKPIWWMRYFTRREFHDDRAAFFETFFSKGREYVYLLKVVNPGKYHISPARVQPMYQPQYFATTESYSLEVR